VVRIKPKLETMTTIVFLELLLVGDRVQFGPSKIFVVHIRKHVGNTRPGVGPGVPICEEPGGAINAFPWQSLCLRNES